jgi:predicted Holliday junction resolvase-like endonuclease
MTTILLFLVVVLYIDFYLLYRHINAVKQQVAALKVEVQSIKSKGEKSEYADINDILRRAKEKVKNSPSSSKIKKTNVQ